MSTTTVPPAGGGMAHPRGLSVNRQFRTCELCGGQIQIDTIQHPGEGSEDAPPVLEDIEMHIGSCTPPSQEEGVAP